ncbi:uncharacterized protein LOC131254983 isoform X2 [Magnolia sinica]|uniref:uncharacterized protein LOC131254983 isoform X2 n=1 Tax=Magnolia sinica TaxID=86752 RepID=UPI00265A4445|nr:uncharacterized protein LOC131254983 isoform X2 [Magnolia sinica]
MVLLEYLRFWMLPGTCLTSSKIHFKNIRFKSSTNRGPGSATLYGSKQYNLNAVRLTESAMLLSPLQGNFPGRNLGSLQEKKRAYITHSGHVIVASEVGVVDICQKMWLGKEDMIGP